MPEGREAVTRSYPVELSPADMVALAHAAEWVPDFDCKARLRGIRKRAGLVASRGDIGAESLPSVGRIGDIAALVLTSLGTDTRCHANR
jgi:hypothetical protein